MEPSQIFRVATCLGVALIVPLCAAAELFADGFHGAAMSTKSLDDYKNKIKTLAPDVAAQLDKGALRAVTPEELKRKVAEDAAKAKGGKPPGGKIEAKLTEQETESRKLIAKECLDILAYLDNRNIFPREFPDFPLEKIPEYRKMAKQVVGHLGAPGNKAVLSTIASLLNSGSNDDLLLHQDAGKDLVELLQKALESGDVEAADIITVLIAASGEKRNRNQKRDPDVEAFAKKVRDLIIAKSNRKILEDISNATTDKKLKTQLNTAIKAREAKATREGAKVKRELSSSSLADLLAMLSTVDEDRKLLVIELISEYQLSTKEAREHLVKVWSLARSASPPTSTNLRKQVEGAAARGSVDDCLAWLAADDAELHKLIWRQLGPQLEKVGAKERPQIRDTAIETLVDRSTSKGEKRTAIEVLQRLKDPQTAVLLLDALPEAEQAKRIPLDLWPQVAAMLRELTGQKFGPREGQKALEAAGQIKQWRKWRSTQGGAK